MSERLTFNLRGTGRELRDRIAWVAAPAVGTLPEAAAPYLPPVERPNWGFWGVFAFTALLFFRPQDTVRALSPLHLPELVAIAALGAMIGHRINRGLPLVKLSPEIIGVGALAAIMLATVPFSVWPGGALGTFTNVYFKVVLIFILMVNSIKGIKALKWFNWLILSAMGYVAARGVVDFATGNHLVKGERLHGSISGLMGNPNDLAMNMVTFMPAAIVVALTARHTMLRRAVAAGIAVLMLVTIVLTQSRAGVIGFASMVVVLVVLGRNVRPGFGAIALAAVIAAMPMAPASFWNRMASITDSKTDDLEYTGSREARRQLIREGFKVFVERPLTGVGAGQFENYNPPGRQQQWRETHNAPLQVAAETGVIGLVAFCFLILRGAISTFATRRLLARPPRRRPDSLKLVMTDDDRQILRSHSVAMSAALAGWFVCSLFASVAYNWTFYYVLALIVCGRELAQHRLVTARAIEETRARSSSVPARFWRRLMPHTT